MILRFPIHGANNSGAPDYALCGQGTAIFANYDDVALEIKVDGLTVVSTSNISGGLGFVGGVTSKGNTVVAAGVETGLVLALQIDLPKLCSTANVEITCSKADYYTFTNTFTIFNYDIGNNPAINNGNGDPVNYNYPFTIVLVPTTIFDGVSIDMTDKCFASFVGWRQPYNNKLYLFKNNSKPSSTTYYKDGVTIGTSNNVITCATSTEIIHSASICNATTACGCGGSSTTDCSTEDFTFENLVNYIPAWQIFASNTGGCVTDCLIKDEENKAVAYIDFSSIGTIFVNDTEQNPLDTLELTWELYNTQGGLVLTQNYSIPTNTIPISYVADDYSFVFIQPTLGDSIILARLEDNCFECEKSITLEVKDSVNLEITDCNLLQICNYSVTSRYVSISKFIDETTSTAILTKEELVLCACYSTALEDGIYIVDIYDSDSSTLIGKKIVHIWCNIKECIQKFAAQIICLGCSCQTIEAAYNFNAMMVTLYTYFAYIQTIYDYNTLYSVLSVEQITNLIDINKFMERFAEYCEVCKNFENPCGCD